MKKIDLVQYVVILCGIPLGMYLSNYSIIQHEQIQHAPKSMPSMDHGLLDISSQADIPEITSLEVHKDKMHGWNLMIKTNNFAFTPDEVNLDNQIGQGHAHLYINGKKYARIYSPYYHISEKLKPDTEIKVTLNSNQHQTLALASNPIEKSIFLE